MKNLSDFKDKFPKVYVFGSGPTQFEYESLKEIDDPIFFINDTVYFQHHSPSKYKFFFTHHLGINPHYRSVEIPSFYVKDQYFNDEDEDYEVVAKSRFKPENDYIQVDSQTHDYMESWFFEKYDWLLDKDEVIKRNRIATSFGTITTVLYMLWFSGCQECILIGCDPATKNLNHDNRIGGKMIFKPDLIFQNQIFMINELKLNVKYDHSIKIFT